MDREPEPTTDWESEPATKTATELNTEAFFVPQPEPHIESDQVCEEVRRVF